MIVRPIDEVEGETITSLEHDGKKVDVGKIRMKWLTYKDFGGYKLNFAVRYVTLEPGSMIPMHEHEHAHSIFILKGKLEVTSGEETRELGPDTFYYVPSFESHETKNIGSELAVLICCINCIGKGENCAP
jgi:quercetin dioxygenase-like cupin family protein